MKVISVKIEEELFQELEIYSINQRLPRSVIIRKAIEKYLSEELESKFEP